MLKKSLNASLSLLLCLSLLFAFAGTTHAQGNIDKKVKMAVDRALSDRGKIHLGSPPKYPYLFHTFWFEKGDWAWGMGLDFNYQNTVVTGDDTNSVRDFTGWDEIEYRFGARLDKWLDLYVTADFAANDDFAGAPGTPGVPIGSRFGFHEGDVRWAILDMHGLPLGPFSNLRIGQQITPMTIDNWTSPQNGSFIHKSYLGAFAGAYHQGFTFWDFQVRTNPKLVYSFSVMKQTESGATNQPNTIVSGMDRDEWDDVDIMGQLGWHPWFRGPSNMLYFEISGGLFKPDGGTHTFAFPGIGHGAPGSTPALASITAEEYRPLYLSARYGNGPFWALAEYADVEADNCQTTPGIGRCASASANADGYHLTMGYFLTGESKPWSPAVGVNGRAKPAKPFNPVKKGKGYGIGAWELKFRIQEIDMSEFGPPVAAERENMAFGINWYLTENLIFMTEYETEELKERPGDPEIDLINTQFNLRM